MLARTGGEALCCWDADVPFGLLPTGNSAAGICSQRTVSSPPAAAVALDGTLESIVRPTLILQRQNTSGRENRSRRTSGSNTSRPSDNPPQFIKLCYEMGLCIRTLESHRQRDDYEGRKQTFGTEIELNAGTYQDPRARSATYNNHQFICLILQLSIYR